MNHRELPKHEWPRLAGTDLADIGHPVMVPARVLVVEDEAGRIIAHWSLMQFWHLEGARIFSPFEQSASVARHMLVGIKELMAEQGAQTIYTGAKRGEDGEAVRQMLTKLGAVPVPMDPFVWHVSA